MYFFKKTTSYNFMNIFLHQLHKSKRFISKIKIPLKKIKRIYFEKIKINSF